MTLLRISALALLLLFFIPPPGMAEDAEQAYQGARESYRRLQDSTKKQLYRDNWAKVIDGFLAVRKEHPSHSRAASALYMAAKASQGLYGISRVERDARRAAGLYDELADAYPRDSLADDALVLSAGIFENVLRDPAQAYLRYARAAKEHPGGDMAPTAARKTAELSRYAPPRKARSTSRDAKLTGIRFWSNPGYTRVVLQLSDRVDYRAHLLGADPKNGELQRIYVDLMGASPERGLDPSTQVDDGLLRRIRTGSPGDERTRVVLDLVDFKDYKVFPLEDPYRIVIDVGGERPLSVASNEPEFRTPPPAGDEIVRILEKTPEERPLKVHIPSSRAGKGLRRIVVDAGHGGKDPGAVGPGGTLEKDVTLAMAKKLAPMIERELGCEVVLTRDRDVYLPLEERTAIANKVGADLFVSIHANANRNRTARGVETYYLNFSKNDKAAAVAARENGTSLKQVGDLELILFDLMANSKINESSRLAAEIQRSLVEELGRSYSDVRDLGVKQGPFYVLVGATMPSVLVEAAFISNKKEERRLTDRKFQEKAGSAIVEGIRKYATALKLMAAK